jgi:ketosteroid isomerase-like protein
MPEESTTPNLIELVTQAFGASNRHDLDAIMRLFAPDAVWDLSDLGLGTFDGAAKIRGFIEDWWGTWGDHLVEVQESVDLGRGIVFSRVREDGRLVDSDRHVEQRLGWVFLWVQGRIGRLETYLEVDEARAAAERHAEERG